MDEVKVHQKMACRGNCEDQMSKSHSPISVLRGSEDAYEEGEANGGLRQKGAEIESAMSSPFETNIRESGERDGQEQKATEPNKAKNIIRPIEHATTAKNLFKASSTASLKKSKMIVRP